jgi:hypothetical protein
MDKNVVKKSKGPRILEIVVGIAAAAVMILIALVAIGGQVTAEQILWGSGAIVLASVGGLVAYIVAAITGAIPRY